MGRGQRLPLPQGGHYNSKRIIFHLVGVCGAWIPSLFQSLLTGPFQHCMARRRLTVTWVWGRKEGDGHCPPARWQTAEGTGGRPSVTYLAFISGHMWSFLASLTQPLTVSRVCVLSSSFFSNSEKGGVCIKVWGDASVVKRSREIIDVALLVPGNCREQTYWGVSKLPVSTDTWKAQWSERLAFSSFTKDSRANRPVGQPGGQVALG